MSYLPYAAPAEKDVVFENIVRVTTNQIITLGEAVGLPGRLKELPKNRKTGQPANPNIPFWDFVFETLDAKFSDGNPLRVVNSCKLAADDGSQLDRSQRPYLIAQSFVGVQVRAAPFTAEADARFRALGFDLGIDPEYDPSQVLGRAFRVQSRTQKNRKGEKMGKDFYLALEALPADYVFTGQVRIVTSTRDGVTADQNGVPTQAVLTDIAVDESAASAVANAIDGATPDDDTVMSILRAADLGNLALNGKSFLELMANDALISSLTTAGIVVTTSEGRLRSAEAELTA